MATPTASRRAMRRKVAFTYRAPEARDVRLAGPFTRWDAQAIPMQRGRDGTWKAEVTLTPGRYEYRFLVDGAWQNDPACGACTPNPFGAMNCVIEVAG